MPSRTWASFPWILVVGGLLPDLQGGPSGGTPAPLSRDGPEGEKGTQRRGTEERASRVSACVQPWMSLDFSAVSSASVRAPLSRSVTREVRQSRRSSRDRVGNCLASGVGNRVTFDTPPANADKKETAGSLRPSQVAPSRVHRDSPAVYLAAAAPSTWPAPMHRAVAPWLGCQCGRSGRTRERARGS
jgi:hypothetical protein